MNCSTFSYVAFSPFVFLKYSDVIESKAESYEDIGVLIVDKTRVLSELYEVIEENYYDKELFKTIEEHFK